MTTIASGVPPNNNRGVHLLPFSLQWWPPDSIAVATTPPPPLGVNELTQSTGDKAFDEVEHKYLQDIDKGVIAVF
jgi:hypothetical protein